MHFNATVSNSVTDLIPNPSRRIRGDWRNSQQSGRYEGNELSHASVRRLTLRISVRATTPQHAGARELLGRAAASPAVKQFIQPAALHAVVMLQIQRRTHIRYAECGISKSMPNSLLRGNWTRRFFMRLLYVDK